MLTTEDQLSVFENTVILFPSGTGLPWQTAGALQRLGRKMAGVFATEQDLKDSGAIPMQQVLWTQGSKNSAELETILQRPGTSVVLALEPGLGSGSVHQAEWADFFSLLQDLSIQAPEAPLMIFVPEGVRATQVEQMRAVAPRSAVFLCPVSLGFRDGGWMDLLMTTWLDRPALLQGVVAGDRSFSGIFVGDLAALVVSCLSHWSKIQGRTWSVPGSLWTAEMVRAAFVKSFESSEESVSRFTWQALLSSFSPWRHTWADRARELLDKQQVRDVAPSAPVYPSIELVFPTVKTSLERAMSQSARAFKRHPEMDLVFGPGRAL